jgi:hypothetical protein
LRNCVKNLVGWLSRGRMAMSQNMYCVSRDIVKFPDHFNASIKYGSPEIYWKLWVKTTWNILEKNLFCGVRTLLLLTANLKTDFEITQCIHPYLMSSTCQVQNLL